MRRPKVGLSVISLHSGHSTPLLAEVLLWVYFPSNTLFDLICPAFLASAKVSMQYQIVATSSFKIPYINFMIREQAVRELNRNIQYYWRAFENVITMLICLARGGNRTPVGYASVAR